MPAAASRNQCFRRLCHAPQLSHGYRRQAATAGGSVKDGPLGLSGLVWSGLAAVRWFVARVVAARRGGHPAPPSPEQGLAYLVVEVIKTKRRPASSTQAFSVLCGVRGGIFQHKGGRIIENVSAGLMLRSPASGRDPSRSTVLILDTLIHRPQECIQA